MLPIKQISVAPLAATEKTVHGDEENREELIPEGKVEATHQSRRERSKSQNKRAPSQAYMKSAKSNRRLTNEMSKKNLQFFEYYYPVRMTKRSERSLLASLERVGGKTIFAAIFLVSFSLGILIGTFASIDSLPRQGFYLFLVIGLIVFVPACYSVYTVLGKFYQW